MYQLFSRVILPLIAIIAISISAYAKDPIRTIEGTVIKVSDGDTITLQDNMGTKVKVRLYGVDAPETEKGNKKKGTISKPGMPFGEEAYQVLTKKINRKNVKLDVMAIDQYKRTVGIIHLDGRNINQEMVAEGYAWAYRQYLDRPHASEYIQAEDQARSRKLGLWQQNNPQPPWEFRKMLKKSD